MTNTVDARREEALTLLEGHRRKSVAVAGGPIPRPSGRGLGRRWLGVVAVPAVVIVGFAVLAAIAVIADQTDKVAALNNLRDLAAHVVGKNAATSTLQAVATGLVTVTSITFSVLLLAVQQTASNLSPVVFDQFLRRRANQVFAGFFVGLALFSYVVMTAVKDKTPPILGATFATLLTVVALIILLGLVFSTVDQMRPTNVVRAIHDAILSARRSEVELFRRTLRTSASQHDVEAVFRSEQTGYLCEIRLDAIQAALSDADEAEITLHVGLGEHVSYGAIIASVRDGDPRRAGRVAAGLADALRVSPQPNLADDATTGIIELGNIAWTSGSSAKQNPHISVQVLDSVRDLAMRWMLDDPAASARDSDDRLPVVYADTDLDRILDVVYDLFVSAHEAHQHMLAGAVLDVYGSLLDSADGHIRARLLEDVATARDLLDDMPASRVLQRARRAFDDRARQAGCIDGSPAQG